jgi:BlaI family penicillinase repressor
MNNYNPSDLGELEREVLLHVWRLGSASAEQIRAALDRPLKESTVRTVLGRLEEKRRLVHSVQGRTFIYSAAQSRGRVAADAVKRIWSRRR